ncbi:hypothetical protein quinque_006973 [Culex quinquefasciatus]
MIGNEYRFRHRTLNEELFESELTSNGNYVFTWVPKASVTAGKWDIWPGAKPGQFYIHNTKFQHYLRASPTVSWVGAYKDRTTDGKSEWKIQGVKC